MAAVRRVRQVRGFEELLATPFADGVNALCWERSLPGTSPRWSRGYRRAKASCR
ncbi:hypothetical protein EMGBS10_14370 [Opitutia bacterium]|nr:hypothetical protein EMGBS10_14370 [Opitutae bacterium]